MSIISSKTNSKIKHLKKLIENKKYRYENNQYVIEGLRILDSIDEIVDIFISEDFTENAHYNEVEKIAEKFGIETCIIERKLFNSITDTENSQGIIVTSVLKVLNEKKISKSGRYLLFDRIQDPGNMGTLIRSAAAFNYDGIIVTRSTVDPYSPKVVRAAMGAVGKIPIIKIDNADNLKDLILISADKKGTELTKFNWPESFILVIGNEAQGVSQDILKLSKEVVRIPISGNIESLNAAAAGSILIYLSKINSEVK